MYSNHVRRAIEYVDVRKVEGGIGADNGDAAERRQLGIDARCVCARPWRKAWVFGDMNGRKGTVKNIQFTAHWNREVYNVIFAVIRNVNPARKNVQLAKVSRWAG